MRMGDQRRDTGLRDGERREVGRQGTSDGQGHAIAAPIGAATSGRLEVVGGVSRLSIRAIPALPDPDLYRAHVTGPLPDIWVRDGVVTI